MMAIIAKKGLKVKKWSAKFNEFGLKKSKLFDAILFTKQGEYVIMLIIEKMDNENILFFCEKLI